MQNIAVRFFVCSGVVLSALYLIWPATEVRAGRTVETSVATPVPAVLKNANATPLTKVSLDGAAVPAPSSLHN